MQTHIFSFHISFHLCLGLPFMCQCGSGMTWATLEKQAREGFPFGLVWVQIVLGTCICKNACYMFCLVESLHFQRQVQFLHIIRLL